MKIANRFFVILASILLGGLLGVGYFVAEWYRTAPNMPSERVSTAAQKEFRSDFRKFQEGEISVSTQKKNSRRVAMTPATPRSARPVRIAPPESRTPTLHALTSRQAEREQQKRERFARNEKKGAQNTAGSLNKISGNRDDSMKSDNPMKIAGNNTRNGEENNTGSNVENGTGSDAENGAGNYAENNAGGEDVLNGRNGRKNGIPMTLEAANEQMMAMARESKALAESLESLTQMACAMPGKSSPELNATSEITTLTKSNANNEIKIVLQGDTEKNTKNSTENNTEYNTEYIAETDVKDGMNETETGLRDAVIQVAEGKKEKRAALIRVADFQATQIADGTETGANIVAAEIQFDVVREENTEIRRHRGMSTVVASTPVINQETRVKNKTEMVAENATKTLPTELPALEGEMEMVTAETAIGNRADMNANPFRNVLIVEVPVNPDGTRITSDNVEIQDGVEGKTETENADSGNVDEEEMETITLREDAENAETTESAENAENAENGKTEKNSRKYELDIHRENVRKALSVFQTETGLKVVASLDVQGEVTCQIKSEEAEALLRNMLAETPYRFVREGEWIYVAREEKIRDLQVPLGEMKTELFVPKHISVEELELILHASMSQFGTLERAQNGLNVTDWTLSLAELRELQKLVDLPPAENRIEAFVFQHELNGAAKALDLITVAENRGLVLQRLAIPELEPKKDKKSIFNKKNKVEPIQAYSISFRAGTFMIAVKDQLGVAMANMPGERTAKFELNQPMSFGFELDIANEKIPYAATLRFFENPKAGEEGESAILAEIICLPTGEVGKKSKPRPIQCTLPILDGNNALVFQLDLGEFAHNDAELKKNPIYAWTGNKIKKEVVVAFCPYQEVQEQPETTLTHAAIEAVIHKQEVLGRKFYGSLDATERENSARYFTLAQRLRQGLEP
ncbi:MAG: hypothetical protein Q4C70_13575 [Planctomycetia bacterium]|nr:hypothetical protein [Planctomycetia bacterium]